MFVRVTEIVVLFCLLMLHYVEWPLIDIMLIA